MYKKKFGHPIRLAIDVNEANSSSRVGSNIYAFNLISAIHKTIIKKKLNIVVTLLSSEPASKDLPPTSKNWKYLNFGPKFMWTQWALPIFLKQKQKDFNVLFTPGHYAPRFSSIPYISSVMDTAYLNFPRQFKFFDRIKLRSWTDYSVKHASRVLAISGATKKSIQEHYRIKSDKVIIASPGFDINNNRISAKKQQLLLKKFKINQPYILFVGTLQPRKNLIRLIQAFEMFSRMYWSRNNNSKKVHPNLVLAGKQGWLTKRIMNRILESPLKNNIILTGYVTEEQKSILYKNAVCSVLIGLHEGFGIPPLESMAYGTIPVVADAASLPEVVGNAGILVNPHQAQEIAEAFWHATNLTQKQKKNYRQKMKHQIKKFSWEKSAQQVLTTIQDVASEVANND